MRNVPSKIQTGQGWSPSSLLCCRAPERRAGAVYKKAQRHENGQRRNKTDSCFRWCKSKPRKLQRIGGKLIHTVKELSAVAADYDLNLQRALALLCTSRKHFKDIGVEKIPFVLATKIKCLGMNFINIKCAKLLCTWRKPKKTWTNETHLLFLERMNLPVIDSPGVNL